jgi:hypothetical protein
MTNGDSVTAPTAGATADQPTDHADACALLVNQSEGENVVVSKATDNRDRRNVMKTSPRNIRDCPRMPPRGLNGETEIEKVVRD